MKHQLVSKLNRSYLSVHTAKEESFWALYMGLKGYEQGSFERNEQEYRKFVSDPSRIQEIRKALEYDDLTNEEKTALKGWLRFFETNAIENREASSLSNRIIAMEGDLNRKREAYIPGYTDPNSRTFTATGSAKLSLIMGSNPSESIRKAAWEGLRAVEPVILSSGFLEIVSERNRLGRMLGYEDYYDYKVRTNEGISKKELFGILDSLVRVTETHARNIIETLKKEKGPDAVKPHNYRFFTQGDLTQKLDPFFPFTRALDTWGKSFTGMGINFRNAELKLDLLYRKGKHENGFMHGPGPCYTDGREFIPARINFTAVAHQNETGGGQRTADLLTCLLMPVVR